MTSHIPVEKPKRNAPVLFRPIAIGIAALFVIVCVWGGLALYNNIMDAPAINTPVLFSSPSPEPIGIISTFAMQTELARPTAQINMGTVEAFVTQTALAQATATPTLGIGSTTISDKDGMALLYVPAGEFIMGVDESSYDEEKPAHTVYLDAYWIDQTEVTNAMYAKCVDDGECNAPSSIKSATVDIYYGIPYYADYPVIYVSWDDATNYCSWAGRRLPTEAEWEKAASWDDETKTKYLYPWGNSISCSFANYIGQEVNGNPLISMTTCVGDTTKVGTYENGKSPYGAYDMVGNVQEWVADLFELYPGGHLREGTFPKETDRVARGGSWDRGYSNSIGRHWADPTTTGSELGFRCAMSTTP